MLSSHKERKACFQRKNKPCSELVHVPSAQKSSKSNGEFTTNNSLIGENLPSRCNAT